VSSTKIWVDNYKNQIITTNHQGIKIYETEVTHHVDEDIHLKVAVILITEEPRSIEMTTTVVEIEITNNQEKIEININQGTDIIVQVAKAAR